MSGNELTSEGTPCCSLFPKNEPKHHLSTENMPLVAESRMVVLCHPGRPPGACTWTQALRLLCSIQRPSSPFVLPPATTGMASLPCPGDAALGALMPGILSHRCYFCRDPTPPSSAILNPLLMLIRGSFPALVFLRALTPVWYEAHAAPRQWVCLFQCMEPCLAHSMNSHDNELKQ